MIIRLNTCTNHVVISLKFITKTSNGISPYKGVPQESISTALNSLLENDLWCFGVTKYGVFENKGSRDGDTTGKEAIEKSKGVNLLNLLNALRNGAEFEQIWVGLRFKLAGC